MIISFGVLGITPDDLIEMCEAKKAALEEEMSNEEETKEISLNNKFNISTKAIPFNSTKVGWAPREEVEKQIEDAVPPSTLAHIQAIANKKYKDDLENYTFYLYMSHSYH